LRVVFIILWFVIFGEFGKEVDMAKGKQKKKQRQQKKQQKIVRKGGKKK